MQLREGLDHISGHSNNSCCGGGGGGGGGRAPQSSNGNKTSFPPSKLHGTGDGGREKATASSPFSSFPGLSNFLSSPDCPSHHGWAEWFDAAPAPAAQHFQVEWSAEAATRCTARLGVFTRSLKRRRTERLSGKEACLWLTSASWPPPALSTLRCSSEPFSFLTWNEKQTELKNKPCKEVRKRHMMRKNDDQTCCHSTYILPRS